MVNFVIIGTGDIVGKRHAPGLANSEKTNLYGYYNHHPEKAIPLAEKYGGKVFQTLEEVYADPNVDAVLISTPPHTHLSLTTGALNAGKHVLLEKPMTLDAHEAQLIHEAAESSGKKLMVLHVQRDYEPHQKMKELLDDGVIGQLLTYRTFLGSGEPQVVNGIKAPWWMNSLFNVMVHRLDLMRYIIGSEAAGVFCRRDCLVIQEWDHPEETCDDHSIGIIQHENGVIGTYVSTRMSVHNEDRSTVLIGTEGAITTYARTHELIVEKKDGEKLTFDFASAHEQKTLQVTGIYDDFAVCIEDGKAPAITSLDGLRSVEIACAMEKADREKRWVTMEEFRKQ